MPVHPGHQKYVAFTWRSRVYFWRVAPFGVKVLPALFSDMLAPLLDRWTVSLGFTVHGYIDDIGAIWTRSREAFERFIEHAQTFHPRIKLDVVEQDPLPMLDVALNVQ